jgi:uncharacterized protein (DUF1501 family)
MEISPRVRKEHAMLKLFPQKVADCETGSRRHFLLEVGALSGLGLTLDSFLRQRAALAAPPARDVNCILIWTRGGTSHHDTLDPKPQANADVRGEFAAIDTALPGIQFTDQMPNFARHAASFTVMRNLNPLNGSHAVADAIMMSGKTFNPAITFPCFGSVVAKEKGYRNNLPPFELPGDPNADNFTVRDITPPGDVSLARVDRRREALKKIDRLQRNLEKQPEALLAIDSYYQNAFSMLTSAATQKAFDLKQEDPRVRETYGRNDFGQSCLLARRLIEAGTRFVTVTSGGWDTHADNFNLLKKLLPPLDLAFPALIHDLRDRGLLETTLVVWMTDFGRTPIINSGAGRDHSSTASVLCMAGAGTPAGTVIGKTDDTGAKPVDKEYYPQDVAATIYTKLGIPLETVHVAPDGRPIRLCEGTVIPELMSCG